jgi:hypothetical protein
VRHGREQRAVQPLRPDRQPLGVATRAEVRPKAPSISYESGFPALHSRMAPKTQRTL